MAKLSAKQQRFVEEYLIDLNATQAAIRAGYKKSEYTDTNANKLLENTRVAEEIAKAMAERSRRTGINQDRVLLEIAKMAFVNIDDVVDVKTGAVKRNASREDLACIQNIKYKKSEGASGITIEREVRIADKKANLELLGRHLGMFKDKIEMDVDMDLNISIDYGEDA